MKNLYADMAMFGRMIENNATLDAADAAEIERLLETASRRIDEICRRHFYALTATRYFDGNGKSDLWIPDLLSVTTLKLDEDGDRTYELTLAAATDYYRARANYEDEDALPKTMLRLDGINGQRSTFAALRRLVEIVGRWGYTQATELVSGTCTLADATTTALTTSASDVLVVGQTIKVEAEDVYVTGGSLTSWTVDRALNGTTAAGHTAQPMNRYVYVPEVRSATLVLAARMWKRREESYANVISNDVEQMLAPLVRWGA